MQSEDVLPSLRRRSAPAVVLACTFLAAPVHAQVSLTTLNGLPPLAAADGTATALSVTEGGDVLIARSSYGATTRGWWRYPREGGAPVLLLEEGKTLLPDGSGKTVVVYPSVNGSSLAVRTETSIFIVDQDGNTTLVWKAGDSIAGYPGTLQASINDYPFPETLNLLGELREEGKPARFGVLVWTKSNGLKMVALEGDAAPGIDLQFFTTTNNGSNLHLDGLSPLGTALVRASFTGAAPDAQRVGWWYGSSATDLKLLWRARSASTTLDGHMLGLSQSFHVYRDGSICFVPLYEPPNPNEAAVWCGAPDKLTKIIGSNDDAAGFHNGIKYDQISLAGVYAEPLSLVFRAFLHADWDQKNVLGPQGFGYWVLDADHSPHLIAWVSKPLDGEPDVKLGSMGPVLKAMNRHGQLVMNLNGYHRFTPGTGFELVARGDSVVTDETGKQHAITELSLVGIDESGRVVFNAKFSDSTAAVVVSSAREPGSYKPWDPAITIPETSGGAPASAPAKPDAGVAVPVAQDAGASNSDAGASDSGTNTGPGTSGNMRAGTTGVGSSQGGSASTGSESDSVVSTLASGVDSDADAGDASNASRKSGGCSVRTPSETSLPPIASGIMLLCLGAVGRLRRRRRQRALEPELEPHEQPPLYRERAGKQVGWQQGGTGYGRGLRLLVPVPRGRYGRG